MPRTAQITQNTSTATIEEWAKLDLEAPNSRVLRLTRVRYDDNDHPLALEEVVFPWSLPGLAADGGEVLDITELAQRKRLVAQSGLRTCRDCAGPERCCATSRDCTGEGRIEAKPYC